MKRPLGQPPRAVILPDVPSVDLSVILPVNESKENDELQDPVDWLVDRSVCLSVWRADRPLVGLQMVRRGRYSFAIVAAGQSELDSAGSLVNDSS